ncbi:MAG: hypothetical protein ACRBN8_13920 [Nannocystales bacterium]
MRPRDLTLKVVTVYGALVAVHITAGVVGLLSMLGALIARKGSLPHRRTGWGFSLAMATTSATGLLVALSWIAVPDLVRPLPNNPKAAAEVTEQLRAAGFFFLVLSLVTAQAITFGILASRRRRADPSRHPLGRMISVLLGLAGVAALVACITGFDPFLAIGGGLGLTNAVRSLRPSRTAPPWLRTHIQAMLGGCTAATTAFTVQLSSRLTTGAVAMTLAWTIPVALGIVATSMWTRKLHARKMVRDAA